MRKRFFSWLVLATLIMGFGNTLVPAYAASGQFSDVPPTEAGAKAIEALKSKGVVEGYTDGTFKPNATINRAELLKILLSAMHEEIPANGNCFPDVNDEWFAGYVCLAKQEGIVSGYDDGNFRPEQPVTFAEAAKIFALAYKQNVDVTNVWYEAYVRALDTSKAIPTSIKGLEKKLTRAEMAQIMWRLSEGITDQPSLGYLNVKYPSLSTNLASDAVVKAASCADLQAFSAEAQEGPGLGGVMMKEMRMNDVAVPLQASPAVNQSAGAVTGSDYSKTNVQVEGVDEADVVKTDGTFLYVLSNGSIRILRANPGKDLKLIGTIAADPSGFYAQDLYIADDRLVVMGQANGGPMHIMGGSEKKIAPMIYPYPYTSRAQARIYDIADRTKPELVRKVSFEGNTVSTRLIGTKLYLVVNQPMRFLPTPLAKPMEKDVLPMFEDSKNGDASAPVARCADVSILPRVERPQYLTVGVIDVTDDARDVKRTTVLGNAENVYASLQNLYVANTEWIYNWDVRPDKGETDAMERTNLYRFGFTSDGIALKAQGSVPGHLLNQFAMDENGSTFRVATTVGRAWNDPQLTGNNLYILNEELQTVGKVENLAKGEQIYAVRFLGDRAYMVTFKTVDPLFVIDTSDPRNPKVLGELKIPGYSTYLHPYDANHIIGFGKDVDESIDADKVHNPNAVYYTAVQGLKMAIFDVTDVTKPRELAKTVIGDRGTDSPLLSNHKALLFEKDSGLLAFPVTVHKKVTPKPGEYQDTMPVFQGAHVYNVSLQNGFQLKGTISHYDPETMSKGGYWYDYSKDIQRIVRIGSSLLTISNNEVMSSTLNGLQREASVTFEADNGIMRKCGNIPCPVPMD